MANSKPLLEWLAGSSTWYLQSMPDATFFVYGEIHVKTKNDFTVQYQAFKGYGKAGQGMSFIGTFLTVSQARQAVEDVWTHAYQIWNPPVIPQPQH